MTEKQLTGWQKTATITLTVLTIAAMTAAGEAVDAAVAWLARR